MCISIEYPGRSPFCSPAYFAPIEEIKMHHLHHFQTDRETWRRRAQKGKLPAVIDPGDLRGRKNLYIDILQKMVIKKALGLEKKKFVIDFGCGSGRFLKMLADSCEYLIGLEITEEMLLLAKDENPCSNSEFVLFDGLRLPTKDQMADAIISVNVLQYITDDSELDRVISELHRSLKPGGRLICIEQGTRNQKRWQRHPKTYLRFFKQNDLKRIANYPVRKGNFLLLYPIYFGLVPRWVFRTIAKFEMFLRRILWHSFWDYQDHYFEMEKK
jgi:SAM-dependent methyltransferase